MSMVEWNENYSVKVNELDEHHKKLVGFINDLSDKMKLGKRKDVIGTIVSDLVEYTKFHFSAEEKYMKDFNYPEYDKHKAEHVYFVKKVEEYKDDLEKTNNLLTIKVLSFLVDWLLNHISNTDKKYSKTFNDNGLK